MSSRMPLFGMKLMFCTANSIGSHSPLRRGGRRPTTFAAPVRRRTSEPSAFLPPSPHPECNTPALSRAGTSTAPWGRGGQNKRAGAVQIGACHHTSRTSGAEQVEGENQVSRDPPERRPKGSKYRVKGAGGE